MPFNRRSGWPVLGEKPKAGGEDMPDSARRIEAHDSGAPSEGKTETLNLTHELTPVLLGTDANSNAIPLDRAVHIEAASLYPNFQNTRW